MTNTLDLHGYKLEDAEVDLHLLIGSVLMKREDSEVVKFITGHGPIREMVLNVLKNEYNLNPAPEIGNPGIIRVEVS